MLVIIIELSKIEVFINNNCIEKFLFNKQVFLNKLNR
jgi:hypothetical protein